MGRYVAAIVTRLLQRPGIDLVLFARDPRSPVAERLQRRAGVAALGRSNTWKTRRVLVSVEPHRSPGTHAPCGDDSRYGHDRLASHRLPVRLARQSTYEADAFRVRWNGRSASWRCLVSPRNACWRYSNCHRHVSMLYRKVR